MKRQSSNKERHMSEQTKPSAPMARGDLEEYELGTGFTRLVTGSLSM
jgi:hypothetical protein